MGVPNPKLPPVDLSNPRQFAQAVRNIRNVANAAPKETVESGKHWYDAVNEATAKGVRRRGLTERQGAGMVAAVSPAMDWKKRNIDAFGELSSIKSADWKKIHASAATGTRTPEAASVLKGMSVFQSSDANLVKAHRIMEGEDPDEVLPRRTAPKTNSFFHNIHEPDKPGPVTIDGRAHDIAANRMQGWEQQRGLRSASLPTGKKTRYEHFEDAYRTASGLVVPKLLPHQLQAVVWEHGKSIEMSAPTKSGAPRKVGVQRSGQRYV